MTEGGEGRVRVKAWWERKRQQYCRYDRNVMSRKSPGPQVHMPLGLYF